jgi:hypothetical protein
LAQYQHGTSGQVRGDAVVYSLRLFTDATRLDAHVRCDREKLRHFGIKGHWFEHRFPGGVLLIHQGAGLSPLLWQDEIGNWALSLGGLGIDRVFQRQGGATGQSGFAQRVMAHLPDIEGLFHIVAYDSAMKTVSVFMDRSGVVPVYYSQDTNGIVISSSALAVAQTLPRVSLSEDTLSCLAILGYPLRNLTLFEQVNLMEPGTRLAFSSEGLVIERWWKPPEYGIEARDASDIAEDLVKHIGSTLELCTTDGTMLDVSLTGGMDSRCVAAIIKKQGLPARFFTGQTHGNEEHLRSKNVADATGLSWRWIPEQSLSAQQACSLAAQCATAMDGEGYPITDISKWSWLIGQDVGRPVRTLWGQGGEILRAYWSSHERIAFLLKGRTRFDRLLNYRCGGQKLPLAILRRDLVRSARERGPESASAFLRAICRARPDGSAGMHVHLGADAPLGKPASSGSWTLDGPHLAIVQTEND